MFLSMESIWGSRRKIANVFCAIRYIVSNNISYLCHKFVSDKTLMKKHLFTLAMLLVASMSFAQKNVLVEENTYTDCQNCPRGIYYGDSLLKTYDNVIFIAIHSTTIDPMSYEEYHSQTGIGGAPGINVNRRQIDIEPSEWFEKIGLEMPTGYSANVNVSNNYDANTRTLTATVTVEALAELNSGYRIGGVVIEDAVTGSTRYYNQANRFGGETEVVGGFEKLPNMIPYYRIAYDHVARQLLTDYQGQSNSIPATLPAGGTASAEFTYVIPEDYNPNYMRVIGYLVAPDGSIDNSAISTYLNGSSNAAPKFTSSGNAEAHAGFNFQHEVYFHDTDDETVSITAINLPNWLNLEQIDDQSATLYGIPIETGSFDVTLQITDGENTAEQSFTINVGSPIDDRWEDIGDNDLSLMVNSMRCDNQGNTYNFGGGAMAYPQKTKVYQNTLNTNAWKKIAEFNGSTDQSYSNMAIASNGDIYITFSDAISFNTFHIMKRTNNSWQAIGDTLYCSEAKVFLDHNDTPYLMSRDTAQNSLEMAYRLENNVWVPLGNGAYANGQCHEMTFDGNDTPYIVYVDNNSSDKVYVCKFENGTWQQVGESLGRTSQQPKIAFDSEGKLYAAINNCDTHNIDLLRFDNGTWQTVAENISGCQTEKFDMTVNGTKLVLAFANQNEDNKLSVVKFNGETYESLGGTTCTSDPIDNASLCFNNNFIQVSFDIFSIFGDYKNASCMRFAQVISFPPANLKAELIQNNSVKLTWETPLQGEPMSYIVYRDGTRITETAELGFTDENLMPGTYHYTVTTKYADGESMPTYPVAVEITSGVNETSLCFLLYPTITASAITISSQINGVLEVYNSNGQKVMTFNISEGENHIDVSGLAQGIYFIGNGKQAVKIIKN